MKRMVMAFMAACSWVFSDRNSTITVSGSKWPVYLLSALNDGWEVGIKASPVNWFSARIDYWEMVATDEIRDKMDDPGDYINAGETQRKGWDLSLSVRPMTGSPCGAPIPVSRQRIPIPVPAWKAAPAKPLKTYRLKESMGMAYLSISHDIRTLVKMADRLAVMHEGCIVETVDLKAMAPGPVHPALASLMGAVLPPLPASATRN